MNELKFSLKLKEVSVELTDSSGVAKKYILRELSGEARDTFLDNVGSRVQYDAEGKFRSLSSLKGLQSGLLTLCLFDDQKKAVEPKTLDKYPATVLAKLFEVAQTLSALDIEGVSEAKND